MQWKMATTRAPASQVGIFTNDLCISFRILMHEILDSYVNNLFEKAKKIHQAMPEPRESFKTVFERGIKSVNTWDSAIKERFRAQISGQYRQITDLYHHIFLMYVQEMYDQTLQDVTVRVNIPSLSNMLHTFVRLACNHSSVCYGEYVTEMNFSARVLFVETILRRMLYELLVQQNNIRGIVSKESKPTGNKEVKVSPTAVRQPVSAKAYSVMSEDDNVSQDLTLGTTNNQNKSGRPRRLSPTTSTVDDDTNRFWKAPETSTPGTAAAAAAAAGLPPIMLQSAKQVLSNGASSSATGTTASKVSSRHSSKHSSVALSSQTASVASKISKMSSQLSGTLNNSTNSVTPIATIPVTTPVTTPLVTLPTVREQIIVTSPAITPSVVKAMTTDSRVQQEPVNNVKADRVEPVDQANRTDRVDRTDQVDRPAVVVNTSKPKAEGGGLFDINSEFTPHKPWGKSLPEAKVNTKSNRPDIEVDSLNLEKSEMSFRNELDNFFATQSQTITPFDSVTEIAAGNRRPPLFFPPNNSN